MISSAFKIQFWFSSFNISQLKSWRVCLESSLESSNFSACSPPLEQPMLRWNAVAFLRIQVWSRLEMPWNFKGTTRNSVGKLENANIAMRIWPVEFSTLQFQATDFDLFVWPFKTKLSIHDFWRADSFAGAFDEDGNYFFKTNDEGNGIIRNISAAVSWQFNISVHMFGNRPENSQLQNCLNALEFLCSSET